MAISANQAKRLIDTHDLTDLAAAERLGTTTSADGRTHLQGQCPRSRGVGVTYGQMSVREYLTVDRRCGACAAKLGADLTGYGALSRLLKAYLTLEKIERALVRTDLTPQRVADATNDLGRHALRVEAGRGADPRPFDDLRTAALATQERLRAAGARMAGDILAQVRTALVGEERAPHATFDHTPTLIGLHPAPYLRDTPLAVLEALRHATVGRGVLLTGPRYVADYMLRACGPSITTVWHASLTPDIEPGVVAQLWDPDTVGPLCDLTTAAELAQTVAAEPRTHAPSSPDA